MVNNLVNELKMIEVAFKGCGRWIGLDPDDIYENIANPYYKGPFLFEISGVLSLSQKDEDLFLISELLDPDRLYPSTNLQRVPLPFEIEGFYDANPDCSIGKKEFEFLANAGTLFFQIDKQRKYSINPVKSTNKGIKKNMAKNKGTISKNTKSKLGDVDIGKIDLEKMKESMSDHLKLMLLGSWEWWGTADPEKSSAQPKNEEVTAWFEEKGMKHNSAKNAASLIRPEWAIMGAKPKKG